MTIPLVLGTVVFAVLFQLNFLIFIYKNLNLESVPFQAVIQLVLFKTPDFIRMTLVIGIALAASLAISRLTRESEVIAMRGAGIPVYRIIAPIAIVGVLLAATNFYVINVLIPSGEKAFYKLFNEVLVLGGAPEFKSNVILKLPSYTASIQNVSRESGGGIHLDKILLFERNKEGEFWVYTSKTGGYKKGIWTLQKPLVNMIRDDNLMIAQSNKELVINERISIPEMFMTPAINKRSLSELRSDIAIAKQNGNDTRELEIAYHSIIAIPIACIIFAIITPIFSINLAKLGSFTGLMVSMVAVLLYYIFFVFSTHALGDLPMITPIMAAWIPNVLFFTIGLLWMRKI